jgi:PhoPQ-activated pathogenicity-related protein
MRTLTLILVLFGLLGGMEARADLDAYLKKPEPAYTWKKNSQKTVAGGTVYDLHLVSQTWQGRDWEHHLQVFYPEKVTHPHFCVLLNTGGNGGANDEGMGMAAAKMAECPFVVLFNIPNQPLYGGLTEDALVVYTWQKFLETGDESWPLHFPMAKAVLKAMDAVQAMAKTEKLASIDEFLITGASKRGWTTWLDGASRDKRIKAIAPMVIDTLNVAVQMPHQLAAYGQPSEQVGDYTNAGMFAKLQTPEGKRLLQLEDPYSYLDRLTLPKLLILGTNDRYWAQDALNFYWDDLKGPKWVMYTPNSGHDLKNGYLQVINTLTAFARAQASRTAWPHMSWQYANTMQDVPPKSSVALTVTSNMKPISARLFRAYAKTQDFRDSKWTSEPMAIENASAVETGQYKTRGSLDQPADGYAALFGELTYEIDGKPFALSTQIHIVKGAVKP